MRRRLVTLGALSLTLACGEVGPSWAPIATDGVAPRWGHVALVDVARDRMIVVGGENGNVALDDVLVLDLGTLAWSHLAVANSPRARTDFAAAIDASRDRLITVGGRSGLATSIADVWSLDLATNRWSPLPNGPSARHDVSAVTDGAHLWVFGGAGELLQSLDDLWELDLATDAWRLLPAPGDHPAARTSVAFAFFDGALWMHGGHDALTAYHDSWRYVLTDQRWERLSPPGNTAAAAHFGQAFDVQCAMLVMSGGDNLDNFDVGFTDGFLLGATPRFVRLPASVQPPPRDHASLIVDPVRHRLVLYGGGANGDGLGTLGDAWIRPLDACP